MVNLAENNFQQDPTVINPWRIVCEDKHYENHIGNGVVSPCSRQRDGAIR
jgi:hypothetical protein